MARQRGIVLPLVLLAVGLLALLAAGIGSAGRVEQRFAAATHRAAALESAVDSAIVEAVFRILDAGPGHWPADKQPREVVLPGVRVAVRIVSESGKINPNDAPVRLLRALLRAAGMDPAGAETAAATIAAARAGGTRFAGLDSLPGRPGAMPDLAPALTFFQAGPPNPRAAEGLALQALRDAAEGRPMPDAGPPSEDVVSITAEAGGFVRRAVVDFGRGPAGALFRFRTWDGGWETGSAGR